jgi:hypothetical protein
VSRPEEVPAPREALVPVRTDELNPGSVVSGLVRNRNRYGVESVLRALYSSEGNPSKDAYVVTLALPGTKGHVASMRCFRDDIWYVWRDEP